MFLLRIIIYKHKTSRAKINFLQGWLKADLRNSIKFILLLLVALFILWFFGRNLDWQEVSQSLRQANPFYLILATLIICLGYLLRAIRWQVLLAPITKTSLTELFAATTIGFSIILIVGRAGEITRPMWLSMRDKRVRPSTALITLGVERIFDLASLVCFFAVNLVFFTAPVGRETEFGYVKLVGNLMLVGVFVGFIALYLYQKNSARFMKWFENYADRIFIPKENSADFSQSFQSTGDFARSFERLARNFTGRFLDDYAVVFNRRSDVVGFAGV